MASAHTRIAGWRWQCCQLFFVFVFFSFVICTHYIIAIVTSSSSSCCGLHFGVFGPGHLVPDRFASAVYCPITAYLVSVRPAIFDCTCNAHLSTLRCVYTCPWLAALWLRQRRVTSFGELTNHYAHSCVRQTAWTVHSLSSRFSLKKTGKSDHTEDKR